MEDREEGERLCQKQREKQSLLEHQERGEKILGQDITEEKPIRPEI